MEKQIKDSKELNGAVALCTNHIYNMCNAKDIETIISSFSEAKDFLIAIYKYNVDRLNIKSDQLKK